VVLQQPQLLKSIIRQLEQLMVRYLLATVLLAAAPFHVHGVEPVSGAAAKLHEQSIVLDTHLDTPSNLPRPGWSILDDHRHEGEFAQVDLPRMKAGGLDGGFWVIYTAQGPRDEDGRHAARDHGLSRLTAIREMLAAHPDHFALALTADDARRIEREGRRIVFLSMENASPLAADPSLLTFYHSLGLRMLGITHTRNNEFGDSSTDPAGTEWGGLSSAGKLLVQEANRLGIVIDASHASDTVFDQLLELSQAPIVLSHTSADAIHDHPRNIDDERLRKLAAKGGVIHVNALGAYLVPTPKIPAREAANAALRKKFSPHSALSAAQVQAWLAAQAEIDRRYPIPRANLDDYMRHVLHILQVVGPRHVGLGADWDGGGGVEGLDDVSALPLITRRLMDAGYSEQDVRNVLGENLLRLLDTVQARAADSGPG
jgi:membrane dipeptidase